MLMAFAFSSFGFSTNQIAQAATTWDATGNYAINQNYFGEDYPHSMSLVQDGSDNLTGNGGTLTGINDYTWVITSGSVVDDTIHFIADYTGTPDAVTPQTTMHVTGIIAPNGTISGTWSDNYAGGERAGTFATSSGMATAKEMPANDGHVMTNPATMTTQSDAALNGTNGNTQAMGHSFWASLNTFSTESTTLPVGVYSTPDLGMALANAALSSPLSSTGIPAITPNTTYYFAAWSNVDGTWYPGEVLNFTTSVTEGQIGGEVVGGNGTLEVTSIEMTDSTATANGTFEDGWEYVFNVTVPTNESDVSMKFADWMRTGGSETLPTANNMRISSAEANNGGATIMITGANLYSTPALTMVTDLDPTLDGIQVKIIVEVKVPSGTTNGAYTTSYGIKSE